MNVSERKIYAKSNPFSVIGLAEFS